MILAGTTTMVSAHGTVPKGEAVGNTSSSNLETLFSHNVAANVDLVKLHKAAAADVTKHTADALDKVKDVVKNPNATTVKPLIDSIAKVKVAAVKAIRTAHAAVDQLPPNVKKDADAAVVKAKKTAQKADETIKHAVDVVKKPTKDAVRKLHAAVDALHNTAVDAQVQATNNDVNNSSSTNKNDKEMSNTTATTAKAATPAPAAAAPATSTSSPLMSAPVLILAGIGGAGMAFYAHKAKHKLSHATLFILLGVAVGGAIGYAYQSYSSNASA